MLQDNAVTSLADLMGWMLYHLTDFFFNLAPGLLAVYMVLALAAYVGVIFLIIRRRIYEEF